MQKFLLTSLVILGLAASLYMYDFKSQSIEEFQLFKAKFGLKYSGIENIYRASIYNQKVQKINAHNSNPKRTYNMGINQFTALTDEQFVHTYLGYKPIQTRPLTVEETIDISVGDVDWRTSGGVGDVKNQGQCGSCWAFSTTGSLQFLQYSQSGNFVTFSQQQLVDCSTQNAGCNGGSMFYAFAYTATNGISTESDYPYTAKDGTCQPFKSVFKNSDYTIPIGCLLLANALNKRPISVAVDATVWSPYQDGIFSGCTTPVQLNHGVLLVGSTNDYWVIKNSWSKTWGENGYIRLPRGNSCGVCNQPSFAI